MYLSLHDWRKSEPVQHDSMFFSLPNCMRCDLFRILKQFCCWCFFCGAMHIIRLKTIILISSSNHVVKNFRDIGSSSSAPGLKGNMAFRSRERAVAFGSLVGLPIVLDQTSGRNGLHGQLGFDEVPKRCYSTNVVSWNINSRTCQLANSKVSIGFNFITLKT